MAHEKVYSPVSEVTGVPGEVVSWSVSRELSGVGPWAVSGVGVGSGQVVLLDDGSPWKPPLLAPGAAVTVNARSDSDRAFSRIATMVAPDFSGSALTFEKSFTIQDDMRALLAPMQMPAQIPAAPVDAAQAIVLVCEKAGVPHDVQTTGILVPALIFEATTGWDAIQEVAEKTLGAAWMSETGTVVYRNAATMRGVGAVTETIASLDSVEDVAWTFSDENVADRCTVTYTPFETATVTDNSLPVWESQSTIVIAAGATVVIEQDLEGAAGSLAPWKQAQDESAPATQFSRWNAAYSVDGGDAPPASVLTVTSTLLTASRVRITLKSNATKTLYVADFGYQSLILRANKTVNAGAAVTFETGASEDTARNTASLDVGLYAGSEVKAKELLGWLALQSAAPRGQLDGLRVVPDPARRLGSVVQFADPVTGLSSKCVITAKTDSGSAGVLDQHLTLVMVPGTAPGPVDSVGKITVPVGTSSGPTLAEREAARDAKRKPAKPLGLAVLTSHFFDAKGVAHAAVAASFSAPATGTDGLALAMAKFELHGRKVGGAYRELTSVPGSENTITFSPLPVNELWEMRVRALSKSGVPSDFSAVVEVQLAKDTTPPGKPSKPTIEARTGVIAIRWDYLLATGGGMPADFEFVDVEVTNHGGTGFVSAGKILMNGGSLPVTTLPFDVVTQIRFIAVDTSGNRSIPSEITPVTAKKLVDTDLSDTTIFPALDGVQADATAAATAAAQAKADALAAAGAASNAQTTANGASTAASNAQAAANAAAAAAAAAQAKADAAAAAATTAQTTADGKNRLIRSSANPSGTGFKTGDQWWKYEGARLKGYWIHDDTEWVTQVLDGAILAYIDAGTITVGFLAGERLEARSITVNKLAVGDFENYAVDIQEPRNRSAYPLSGAFSYVSDAVLSPFGAAAPWVVKLGPSGGFETTTAGPDFRVTPGETIYASFMSRNQGSGVVGALNLMGLDALGNFVIYDVRPAGSTTGSQPDGVWGTWEGKLKVPAGVYLLRPQWKRGSNGQTAGERYFTAPVIRRAVAGELVVDGTILAQHVKTNELTVQHFVAGALQAEVISVMSSDHAPGVPAVRIDGQGIKTFDREGGEAVSITGLGDDFITISKSNGEAVATVDNTGGAAFADLTVAGDGRFDGNLIAGGDPLPGHGSGELGPTLMGRDLLGSAFMDYVDDHPDIGPATAWMTAIPHGVALNTFRSDPGLTWDAIGGQAHFQIRLGGAITAIAGRFYQVSYSTPAVRSTLAGGADTLGESRVIASTPGGTIAVGGNGSDALPGSGLYYANIPAWQSGTKTFVLRCPEDIPAGRIMLGIEMWANSGCKMAATGNAGAGVWLLNVLDMGVRRSAYNGVVLNMQKQGTAAPTPPPTPPAPTKKQYITTWNESWSESYRSSNAINSGMAGKAVQGYSVYATSQGVMRGLVGFPSVVSTLSGADIVKVEVYVYAAHWHSNAGGTLCIGGHTHATKPTTWSSNLNDAIRQKLKKPEGRWITLPSSMHAGFKSGTYKGISLLPPASSTSTEYYGYLTAGKQKLRITYKK